MTLIPIDSVANPFFTMNASFKKFVIPSDDLHENDKAFSSMKLVTAHYMGICVAWECGDTNVDNVLTTLLPSQFL